MISREERTDSLSKELELEQKKQKMHKRIGLFLKIFFVIIFLIFAVFCYMRFFATTGLVINEFKIVNEKLPSSFHGFKIVHFSDLHYGSTVEKKELQQLVEKINKLEPDLVVFTGDFVDKETTLNDEDIESIIAILNKIQATTGKYTVKGNHDYTNNYYERIFDKTDFQSVNNLNDLIYYKGYDPILITGIGSNIKGDAIIDKGFEYFENDNANKQIFTISLIHEPDLLDNVLVKYPVDLALTGHSHNGQVRLPFIGPLQKIRGAKKYNEPYYKVNQTDLYVSSGIGTTSYKLRFFNRPSINFYRLAKK